MTILPSNEGAAANRHLLSALAARFEYSFIGLACHAQRRVPVAELVR